MIFTIAALAVVNVLLSPEIAVAFALGWLSYAVLCTQMDWRLLAVSLIALSGTAIGCYFLLPTAYYVSLLQFSNGANNLPMVPAAHLVLYIATLTLLVPPLLEAGWRNERPDAVLLGSLGVLSVVMMPGALGRCDPPHVPAGQCLAQGVDLRYSLILFVECHKQTLARLFDHFVGAGEKGFWNVRTYSFRTLRIHDQLKPARLFDRQISPRSVG